MIKSSDIKIDSLEFTGIKNNIISYLKTQQNFKDFDYSASNISLILNVLAQNAHMIGYYVKMLQDESFIQTTKSMQGIYAHSENFAYTPNGKLSSRAQFKISITMDKGSEPLNGFIQIRKGTTISATNNVRDLRIFNVLSDVFAYDKTYDDVANTVTYVTEPFIAYEGTYDTFRFEVDVDIKHQSFVIYRNDIDINTLKVFVKPEINSDNPIEYHKIDNIFDVRPDSNVFYTSITPDGYYEIFFGNNIIGAMPVNKSIIECTYLMTNGEAGNGANSYKFNSPPKDSGNVTDIGNYDDVEIIEYESSYGGRNADTLEEIRFLLPNYIRRQNRLVTKNDYKTILMDQYRNIESINVWGGEENFIKSYGKTFVSIKPIFADQLTSSAKDAISNRIVKQMGIVGSDIVFVNPEFIDVSISLFAYVDLNLTNLSIGEIDSGFKRDILLYNQDQLNVFDSMLSESNLIEFIRQGKPHVLSAFTTKTFSKVRSVIHGSIIAYNVLFGNELDGNVGVKSDWFTYGINIKCYLKSDSKNDIYLFGSDDKKILQQSFGTVDLKAGVINFSLPQYAKTANDSVTWFATPVKPDIETYNNNIVRITNITTSIKVSK